MLQKYTLGDTSDLGAAQKAPLDIVLTPLHPWVPTRPLRRTDLKKSVEWGVGEPWIRPPVPGFPRRSKICKVGERREGEKGGNIQVRIESLYGGDRPFREAGGDREGAIEPQ